MNSENENSENKNASDHEGKNSESNNFESQAPLEAGESQAPLEAAGVEIAASQQVISSKSSSLNKLEKVRTFLSLAVVTVLLIMLVGSFFTSPDFSSSLLEAIESLGEKSGINISKNIAYTTPPDSIRTGDMYTADDTRASKIGLHPAVVIVHGGSWTKGSNQDIEIKSIARHLAKLGYRSFAINLRLNGTGGEFPNDIRDINSSLCFLEKNAKKFQIDKNSIFLLGTSSGATSCLTAAYGRALAEFHEASCTPKILGVAAFSTPSNLINDVDNPYLAEYLHMKNGKPGKEILDKASPINYVRTAIPTILLHGTDDQNVSINESIELAKQLQKHNVKVAMIKIEGQAHFIGAESRRQGLEVVHRFFMSLQRN